MEQIIFTPTDFVAVFNQTIEYAFGTVVIEGEIANFQIRKNKWVFFDVKDEQSSVKCFATIYQLPGPLEDGLMVRIVARPQLHPQFNFSLSVQSIAVAGEGSIKKAATLLAAKLEKEGLFSADRKKILPYPPESIGLVASFESAAYADFNKVIKTRWSGLTIIAKDVQVQGEVAPQEIVSAIEFFNKRSEQMVDVIVITRGGGSAEDLAAFNDERVVRAVAESAIPTIVAIGHEVDVSLSELAADMRASTPSNAAELLVPEKTTELRFLQQLKKQVSSIVMQKIDNERRIVQQAMEGAIQRYVTRLISEKNQLHITKSLLRAYHPHAILKRGYAIVKSEGRVVTASKQLTHGDTVTLVMQDGEVSAVIG